MGCLQRHRNICLRWYGGKIGRELVEPLHPRGVPLTTCRLGGEQTASARGYGSSTSDGANKLVDLRLPIRHIQLLRDLARAVS